MDLEALETKHGDYYVPAFKVAVDGKDLVRELFLTVTSAEVDLKERTAGRFTFTVANAFDWESRAFIASGQAKQIDLIERFAFGSPIEIFFGYGEPSKLSSMLSGIVTEISTSFREGAVPELTVSGYDDLYPLITGKNTRYWEDARDSDAVEELVVVSGLTPDVQRTEPEKPRIDQSQQADIAFLETLAERNSATFYARDGRFYFGPRNNDKTEVLELPWGKGLLSFSPEANLACQVKTVEVNAWSAERGEPIVGTATSGDESGRDGGRKSGGERVAEALHSQPTMRVRAAVHTQAEAEERARAILEERSQEFLKGTGDCIGLPELVPDINIGLKGLGETFSKTYYVSAVKHTVNSSGYRTSFTVQETTI